MTYCIFTQQINFNQTYGLPVRARNDCAIYMQRTAIRGGGRFQMDNQKQIIQWALIVVYQESAYIP